MNNNYNEIIEKAFETGKQAINDKELAIAGIAAGTILSGILGGIAIVKGSENYQKKLECEKEKAISENEKATRIAISENEKNKFTGCAEHIKEIFTVRQEEKTKRSAGRWKTGGDLGNSALNIIGKIFH